MLPIWQTKLIISCNHIAYVPKIIINDQGCQPYFHDGPSVFRSCRALGICALCWGKVGRKEAVTIYQCLRINSCCFPLEDSGGVTDKAAAVNINRVFT